MHSGTNKVRLAMLAAEHCNARVQRYGGDDRHACAAAMTMRRSHAVAFASM